MCLLIRIILRDHFKIVMNSVYPAVLFHFAAITTKSIILMVIAIVNTADTVRNLICFRTPANRN